MLRRTKILATVGPASFEKKQLSALMDAGVDVFRLNFSHGDHADKVKIIEFIRTLSREKKKLSLFWVICRGLKFEPV